MDLFHCVFGIIGLLSGDVAKGWEHGCIGGSSVIKESASDFLNNFLSVFLRRGLVLVSSIYCAFAPYVGFMSGCRWSCGFQGCLWWKILKASKTYESMERWNLRCPYSKSRSRPR